MNKRRDQMAPQGKYPTGSAKLPKHIRIMLESQQQQIEQLTGLLRSMSGTGGPDPTVSELCDRWEVAVRPKRSKESMRVASTRLGTIKAATSPAWRGKLGDVALSELTPEHFEAYQTARAGVVAASTVRAEAIILRAVFNWARKKKVIKTDPFAGAEMLYDIRARETTYKPHQVSAVYNWLVTRSKEVRHAYPDSAEKYLDAAAAVLAGISTGIRPKELCALQVHQLSPRSRDVTITSEQSKGGYSGRRVRLSEEAHAALLERCGGRTEGPILRAGYRAIAERWREACDAMGIVAADGERPHWYGLRHSFASAAASKVPVWALMKALGHSKVTTTQRYVKVDFSQTAVAFESVHTSYLSVTDGEANDT